MFGVTQPELPLIHQPNGGDCEVSYCRRTQQRQPRRSPARHRRKRVRLERAACAAHRALDWTASQETTDTTITRLSAAGSFNFPTQPANSIVNGTVWVTGVSDAGVCSSFRIDFTSERIGTGTPTLRANTTTTVYNGLSLPTVPTMNVTSGGIYRVQVVGLAATNIRWDARFSGQQVVFA